MRRFAFLLTLGGLFGAANMWAQSPPTSHTGPGAAHARTPDLLDRLVGRWQVVGQVHGRPATYAADGHRVLSGRFVELDMTDISSPPAYEARVFIGEDTTATKVLVHWLDNFGAAYSVPAASGRIVGDTIRFEFAYSSGPFRDTFVYHRANGGWTFRLEAGDGSGGWRPFADYEVRRSKKAGGRAPAH